MNHHALNRFPASVALLLLFAFAGPTHAREIANVDIPEHAVLGEGGSELVLNGAGIRTKFFVKVYIGALYLMGTAHSTEAVLAMPGAKRVSMHILYGEISRKKLVNGWNDGFSANHTEEAMEVLRSRLDRFNEMFQTVHKGDVIWLDYVPGEGTLVWINGGNRGTVEGEDFYTALLRVWLGEEPADWGLKKGMLGASSPG